MNDVPVLDKKPAVKGELRLPDRFPEILEFVMAPADADAHIVLILCGFLICHRGEPNRLNVIIPCSIKHAEVYQDIQCLLMNGKAC